MALKDHSLKAGTKAETALEQAQALLGKLDDSTLAQLRHDIDSRLQLDLASLNLENEIGLQYLQGKALLNAVNNDASIATNQKAQIFNAVRAQLAEIIQMQAIVWDMERLKKFEVAFTKCAGLLTNEARLAFYDLYGSYLKEPSDEAVR